MAGAVARGRGRSRDHGHKQRQELSQGELLSLITGLAAHVALDECLHPLVGWCARRDLLELGGEESHHHRLVEKYHSLSRSPDARPCRAPLAMGK
jgi:hypothetical protein